MHLHAVEASGFGVFGGVFETCNDAGEFIVAQFTRGDVGLLALRGVNFVPDNGEGAGGDRLGSAIEQRMAGTATVPDLQHDLTAFGMDGIRDDLPAFDLGRGVDARLHPEGGVPFHGHGGFSNDESGAGAL